MQTEYAQSQSSTITYDPAVIYHNPFVVLAYTSKFPVALESTLWGSWRQEQSKEAPSSGLPEPMSDGFATRRGHLEIANALPTANRPKSSNLCYAVSTETTPISRVIRGNDYYAEIMYRPIGERK
jgi:hypothetical protein